MPPTDREPARPLGELLRVVRATPVTPRLRRVTLAPERGRLPGADAPKQGPNVKLFFPRPSETAPAIPWRDEGGRMVWPAGSDRSTVRTYTVRRFDAAAGELDVDFVLHGAGGVAAAWAAVARPGDAIGVSPPGGISVRPAAWYLLAGDQSALPAIGAILERLPPTARGIAIIAVPGAAERQPLRHPQGVDVRWLDAGGADIPAAVRAVAWPALPSEDVFVWIGAESAAVRAVRRHLAGDRALDPRRKLAIGYWKQGMPEQTYHDAYDNDRAAEDRYESYDPAPVRD